MSFLSSYFSHLFNFSLVLSINLSVAVLYTLARNRTVGPAEPDAKRLPSSVPVCYDIVNKPTRYTFFHSLVFCTL